MSSKKLRDSATGSLTSAYDDSAGKMSTEAASDIPQRRMSSRLASKQSQSALTTDTDRSQSRSTRSVSVVRVTRDHTEQLEDDVFEVGANESGSFVEHKTSSIAEGRSARIRSKTSDALQEGGDTAIRSEKDTSKSPGRRSRTPSHRRARSPSKDETEQNAMESTPRRSMRTRSSTTKKEKTPVPAESRSQRRSSRSRSMSRVAVSPREETISEDVDNAEASNSNNTQINENSSKMLVFDTTPTKLGNLVTSEADDDEVQFVGARFFGTQVQETHVKPAPVVPVAEEGCDEFLSDSAVDEELSAPKEADGYVQRRSLQIPSSIPRQRDSDVSLSLEIDASISIENADAVTSMEWSPAAAKEWVQGDTPATVKARSAPKTPSSVKAVAISSSGTPLAAHRTLPSPAVQSTGVVPGICDDPMSVSLSADLSMHTESTQEDDDDEIVCLDDEIVTPPVNKTTDESPKTVFEPAAYVSQANFVATLGEVESPPANSVEAFSFAAPVNLQQLQLVCKSEDQLLKQAVIVQHPASEKNSRDVGIDSVVVENVKSSKQAAVTHENFDETVDRREPIDQVPGGQYDTMGQPEMMGADPIVGPGQQMAGHQGMGPGPHMGQMDKQSDIQPENGDTEEPTESAVFLCQDVSTEQTLCEDLGSRVASPTTTSSEDSASKHSVHELKIAEKYHEEKNERAEFQDTSINGVVEVVPSLSMIVEGNVNVSRSEEVSTVERPIAEKQQTVVTVAAVEDVMPAEIVMEDITNQEEIVMKDMASQEIKAVDEKREDVGLPEVVVVAPVPFVPALDMVERSAEISEDKLDTVDKSSRKKKKQKMDVVQSVAVVESSPVLVMAEGNAKPSEDDACIIDKTAKKKKHNIEIVEAHREAEIISPAVIEAEDNSAIFEKDDIQSVKTSLKKKKRKRDSAEFADSAFMEPTVSEDVSISRRVMPMLEVVEAPETESKKIKKALKKRENEPPVDFEILMSMDNRCSVETPPKKSKKKIKLDNEVEILEPLGNENHVVEQKSTAAKRKHEKAESSSDICTAAPLEHADDSEQFVSESTKKQKKSIDEDALDLVEDESRTKIKKKKKRCVVLEPDSVSIRLVRKAAVPERVLEDRVHAAVVVEGKAQSKKGKERKHKDSTEEKSMVPQAIEDVVDQVDVTNKVVSGLSFKQFFKSSGQCHSDLSGASALMYQWTTALRKRSDDLPKQFLNDHAEAQWQMILHATKQLYIDQKRYGYLLDDEITLKADVSGSDDDEQPEERDNDEEHLGEEGDEILEDEDDYNDDDEEEEEEGDLFNMNEEDLEDLDEKLKALDSDIEYEDNTDEIVSVAKQGPSSVGEKSANDSEERKFKKTVVDDRFFSLRRMEAELDEVEKNETRETENLLETLDDNWDGPANYNYEDFFGKRDLVPEDESKSTKKNKRKLDADDIKTAKKKKTVRFADAEVEDEEDVDEDDEQEMVSDEVGGEDVEVNERPVLFGEQPQNDEESGLQKRMKKIKDRIRELEKENLAPRSWELQGEVSASAREEDALLQQHIQFDASNKKPPEITEDFTAKLEGIITQRIKDKLWDDPIRKVKMTEVSEPYRTERIEDRELIKQSLSDVYEKEYQKAAGEITSEVKKNESHEDIDKRMRDLFANLDALCHYEFAPPAVKPELKIVSNMAALRVEEVGAMASTDEQLLAPEEMQKHQKGDIMADDERSKTDKLRARRKKKNRQRVMAARDSANGASAENQDDSWKNKGKKGAKLGGVVKKDKTDKMRTSEFMTKLNDTVKAELAARTSKKSQEKAAVKEKFGSSKKFVL